MEMSYSGYMNGGVLGQPSLLWADCKPPLFATEMTKKELDEVLAAGVRQADRGELISAAEVKGYLQRLMYHRI